MSNSARERIFAKLHVAIRQGGFDIPEPGPMPVLELSRQERIDRLKSLLEIMHAEVYVAGADNWVNTLKEVLRKRSLNQLLYAPGTWIGEALEQAWESDLPPLTSYSTAIEQFKATLFASDASITSTRGGIAETGALILWPDVREPRSLSLVPAVHIAVLVADKIYNTFTEAIASERWQDGMPTNALLISGPSKTADIELTLTFGVHGPKELIVFILDRTYANTPLAEPLTTVIPAGTPESSGHGGQASGFPLTRE